MNNLGLELLVGQNKTFLMGVFFFFTFFYYFENSGAPKVLQCCAETLQKSRQNFN